MEPNLCPGCGYDNVNYAKFCQGCGQAVGASEARLPPPTPEYYGPASLAQVVPRQSSTAAQVVSILLVIGAILLLVAGFAGTDNAITQTACFAAAAVLAILARIAQAAGNHVELMNELRRR